MKFKSILHIITKKHAVILLINSILTILMLIGCFRYSILESFAPYSYAAEEALDQIYHNHGQYVKCTVPLLHYSGYDYLSGDQVKGHYYYTIDDDTCTIFLLTCKQIDYAETPPETLENVTFQARIIKQDSNLTPLLTYMASDLEWNYNGISNITEKYVVSQVDYNPVFNVIYLVITGLLAFCNFITLTFSMYQWNLQKYRKKHISETRSTDNIQNHK